MLKVTRRVLVSAPHDSVRRYLSDLNELARYEPKVDHIRLGEAAEGAVDAELAGRFLGLRWHGFFRFEFGNDGGYRAVMTRGPLKRMECRVSLRPVSRAATMLEHAESYDLPLLLKLFSPLIKRRLDGALDAELGVMKEGAEALNRRLHLQSLEA